MPGADLTVAAGARPSPCRLGLIGLLLPAVLSFVVPYLQDWGGDPYSRADADIAFTFQALLIGDHQPQNEFSHHGYVYFLLLSLWFRAADLFGMVPAGGASELMSDPDRVSAFADLIVAGRAFSMVVGAAFAGLLYLGIWRVTGDIVAAAIAGVMFALGEGLAFQTIVLRTELLASLFLFSGFVALVEAGRSDGWRRIRWLAATGLLCSLAFNTKLQVIFTLAAFPVLALAFAAGPVGPGRVEIVLHGRRTGLALAAAALLAGPAWVVLLSRVGRYGVLSVAFDLVLIAVVVICAAIYGRQQGVGKQERALGLGAIVFGFGLGLSTLFLHYNIKLFTADANPLEHMAQFILEPDIRTDANNLAGSLGRVIASVLGHVWSVPFGGPLLATPHRLLIWVAAAGTLGLALLGRRRAALQIAMLAALVVLQQGINAVRYQSPVYAILSDPWILLALAILIAELRRLPWPVPRAGALALTVLLAAVLVDRNLAAARGDWTQPRDNVCVQANGYLPPDLAASFRPLCDQATLGGAGVALRADMAYLVRLTGAGRPASPPDDRQARGSGAG